MPDIDTLIQRWQDGDERAAEALYNHHRERVFRLAYGLLGDPADAEEAAQDALTYALVNDLPEPLIGALLAVAGGSFIYIAASDLIPESHRSRGLSASLALCIGILFAWGIGFLVH